MCTLFFLYSWSKQLIFFLLRKYLFHFFSLPFLQNTKCLRVFFPSLSLSFSLNRCIYFISFFPAHNHVKFVVIANFIIMRYCVSFSLSAWRAEENFNKNCWFIFSQSSKQMATAAAYLIYLKYYKWAECF